MKPQQPPYAYPQGHPGPPIYGAPPPYAAPPPAYPPAPPSYPAYAPYGAGPPPTNPVVMISPSGAGPSGYPGANAYAGSGLKYIADADAAVRRGFISKVYGILGAQLAITLAFVLAFSFDDRLRVAIIGTPGVLIAAIILSFVFLFALSCFPSVARTYPGNYLCLLGFTLCESLMVGTIAAMYSPEIVVKAVVATTVIVLGLTLFAFQTKIDFTAMSSSMFCILLLLLLFGIWTAIFPSQAARTAYAAIGAVVFSLFICYDTQLIIGGKHQHQFEIDDYCFAALNLYIDIIQLFLFLLRLLGNRDGS